VYVHVPFCARRCDYCAFATWTDRGHLVDAYVDACVREVEEAAPAPAATVFVGGGTPSLLPADRLAGLVAAVPRAPGAEVTVECNPEDVTEARLEAYRAAGVTRVSFGVQSMVSHVLAGLGRVHDPAAVARAVAAAKAAGFETWNVDLIYGGAGESVDDWRRTVEAVLALEPPHVSAYALTVEPGTPLASDPGRYPDDDDQADKYLLADALLGEAGLVSYEISNWARPGHECRHNLLYWRQGDYRGIGCAAHSHEAGRRWWNVRTPERYIAAVAEGRSVVAGEEVLDEAGRALEALQLSLRTRDGVPAAALGLEVEELVAAGLVEQAESAASDEPDEPDEGRRVRLTPRGRLLASDIALRLRVPST
jgi:putative oxygen-independent coproporphyrinogen III oxidase